MISLTNFFITITERWLFDLGFLKIKNCDEKQSIDVKECGTSKPAKTFGSPNVCESEVGMRNLKCGSDFNFQCFKVNIEALLRLKKNE